MAMLLASEAVFHVCIRGYVCGCVGAMKVSIGESTCAAKIFNGPVGHFPGSTALLEAAELSQIAVIQQENPIFFIL